MVVKNVLHQGWYQQNPNLGAPLGQEMYDFPLSPDNFNFLIIKFLGLFTQSFGMVINLFYLGTFFLSVLCAFVAFRSLKVSLLFAGLFALVFGFLPYHFTRGENHLFLSGYYAVPLAGLLLIWCLSEEEPLTVASLKRKRSDSDQRSRRRILAAGGICILIGSTGAYYAVFTLVFLAAGALILLARGQRRRLGTLALLATIILTALAVNLAPSLRYIWRNGRNPAVVTRPLGDQEMYGLKISQLLMPLEGHRLKPLAAIKERSLKVPYTSEFQSLGAIASVGFLFLFWIVLRALVGKIKDPEDRTLRILAILNLIAVLVGTISGFAFLLSMAGLKEIRAWNRISIFIAFFSLAGLGLFADRFIGSLRSRWSTASRLGPILAIALLGLAIFDQTSDRFVPDYPTLRREFDSDRDFVKEIEKRLGGRGSIFQFPYHLFPEGGPVVNMTDYDLTRGFLHSESLKWSYGIMRGRGDEWQPQLLAKPVPIVTEGLVAAGFDGIYIDRNAYADRASALEAELKQTLGTTPIFSRNERLSFFDLRPIGSGKP